jgi:AraC-like DNA-binding protein
VENKQMYFNVVELIDEIKRVGFRLHVIIDTRGDNYLTGAQGADAKVCGKRLTSCLLRVATRTFFNLHLLTAVIFCYSALSATPANNVSRIRDALGTPGGHQKTTSLQTTKRSGKKKGASIKAPVITPAKAGKRNDSIAESERRVKKSNRARKVTWLSAELKKIIESKFSTFDMKKPLQRHGSKLLIAGIFSALILFVVLFQRQKYESKRFMTTTRLSIMDKEVQRACRYIEDNYSDQDLGLPKICRVLVTGEAFVEALFEKELGLTTGEFIDQVRINRAKILLHQSPDQNPAVLAAMVGYSGKEAFYSSFLRITGVDFAAYCSSLTDSKQG